MNTYTKINIYDKLKLFTHNFILQLESSYIKSKTVPKFYQKHHLKKTHTDIQCQAEGSQTIPHPPKREMIFVFLFVKIIIYPRKIVAIGVL